MEVHNFTTKIREAAAKVAAESAQVRIDQDAIVKLARQLAESGAPAAPADVFFFDGNGKTVLYHLLLAATDFCLWPSRYVVEFHGERSPADDPSRGLALAWHRAFTVGAPVTDLNWLADLQETEFVAMLRPVEGELPLMQERLMNVRDVARRLRDDYGGAAESLLDAGKHHAETLLNALHAFRGFRDEAEWRGTWVPYMARAQRFLDRLARAFQGRDFGRLEGIERLTAQADDRLAQYLRHTGVLAYADDLAGRVGREEPLEANSEAEQSIRAATIVALGELGRGMGFHGQAPTPRDLERRLRLEAVRLGGMAPSHRVITTAY
jgi:hypothetical protein